MKETQTVATLLRQHMQWTPLARRDVRLTIATVFGIATILSTIGAVVGRTVDLVER